VVYSLNRRHFILLYCQIKSSANIQKSRKYIEMKPKSKFLTLLNQITIDEGLTDVIAPDQQSDVAKKSVDAAQAATAAAASNTLQGIHAVYNDPAFLKALQSGDTATASKALADLVVKSKGTAGGTQGSTPSVSSGVTPAV